MANNNSENERRLWEAADEFRANSNLRSSEYSTPVLGLIFLRYADFRFIQAEQELKGKGSGRRQIGKKARGQCWEQGTGTKGTKGRRDGDSAWEDRKGQRGEGMGTVPALPGTTLCKGFAPYIQS